MMHRLWAASALLLCVFSTSNALAGLYNPDEPDEGKLAVTPKELINDFRLRISDLRSIAWKQVQFENALRDRYVLVADLAAGRPVDKLSLRQKLTIAATYLRRGQADQALELLQQLQRKEPENILVQSNLATTYHQSGEFERASDTMQHLLKNLWPEQWTDLSEAQRQFIERIGWHQALYEWNRRVETFYLKLLRQRSREKLRSTSLKDEKPYDLFDDKSKLPRDATDIVQQLLIWLPDDHRLYWLLGELYAAKGTPDDLRAAFALFDDLIDPQKRQYRPHLLVEHTRALEEKVAALPTQSARIAELEGKLNQLDEKKEEGQAPFDWRNLLVGFGSGAIVALFGMWQVREIRRRRAARTTSV